MQTHLSILVFALSLLATLFVSYLGRRYEARHRGAALATHGLNKWLLGLSAGATANSGFVVTAAVGLGYTQGARWLLLPLAWLLGDILFWTFFPQRINAVGKRADAATMVDVLVSGTHGRSRRFLRITLGVITLGCLGGYVSAQWISGQKFLSGAFDLDNVSSLVAFAAVIVVYTALGGFRGSVYADNLQAAIRIVGTAIALVAVWVAASRAPAAFQSNLESAGPDFLHLAPTGGLGLAIASSLGFAAAALGFGLGQPQIVTRYMAGSSPKETRSAWWIYILFVQVTWIAMTAFGIALRGVMPTLDDPETGLSAFHRATTGPLITGIIAADIFATIAATSNSILVAMAQSVKFDLLNPRREDRTGRADLWIPITVLGVITMVVSLFLHSSVKDLALSSVGMMGAGVAPAMMIQVLGWRRSGWSLLCSVIVGFTTAALWTSLGYNAFMNEAAPGILAGLLVNWALSRRLHTNGT
ncbi:Osmoregulated proline transporter OpuE [Phycisphaerales bacterium]|nr:Osmoregulated proline transporter OpuE [Phycisphaerales bacterium]